MTKSTLEVAKRGTVGNLLRDSKVNTNIMGETLGKDSKKQAIKDLIKQLHAGARPEQLKEKFKEAWGGLFISATWLFTIRIKNIWDV